MSPKANSFLNNINSYKPGKSKISQNSEIETVKLSSNENALGASPLAIEYFKGAGDKLSRYPDGSCADLKEKLSAKYDLNPDQITVGAGSDEIIALLAHGYAGVGDEVIYSEHGFLMYPISTKRVGASAVKAPEQNLKTDISAIIAAITDKTKIIFIANPNNPTGSYITKDEANQLIDATPKNILIVFDHAYDEFVEADDYPDAFDLVKQNDNVVTTRTFSKIHGLASTRVGWCYSSKEVSEILGKIRGPFNVNGPAQAAAIGALEDDEFANKSKAHNQKWLSAFKQELGELDSIKLYDSVANFVLSDFFSNEGASRINQSVLENGIIVRQMDAYGLPSCLRVSIGNDQENQKFLTTIKSLIWNARW